MERLDGRHFCRRWWVRGLTCPAHKFVLDPEEPDDDPQPGIPVIPPVPGKRPSRRERNERNAVKEAEAVLEAMGAREEVSEKVLALYIKAMYVLMSENIQGGRFPAGGQVPAGIPRRSEVDAVIRGLARGLDVRELYDVIREMQNIGPTRESQLAGSIRDWLDGFKAEPIIPPPPPGRLPIVPGGKSGFPAFFDPDAGHSVLPGQSRNSLTTNQSRALERANKSLDEQQGRDRKTRPGGNVHGGRIGQSVQVQDKKGRRYSVRVSKYSNLFRNPKRPPSRSKKNSRDNRGDLGRRKSK